MAGCIIENMSGRKLTYVVSGLVVLQVLCFLLGAVISPTPNSSMQYLATKCYDPDGGGGGAKPAGSSWFYPRGDGACRKLDSLAPKDGDTASLTADNVVFAFQMPHPRDSRQMHYSRWQQNLIGVLTADIEYEDNVRHDPRVQIVMEAKLAYKDKDDREWRMHSSSLVHRNLDCEIELKRPGYYYNCSIMPLFELGSLHHELYLLNIRLPTSRRTLTVGDDRAGGNGGEINGRMGKLVDLWLVTIHQNGGFTKVWVSLKTVFLPLVVGELAWFWRRIGMLPRPPTLLEKTLFALGVTVAFLDLPLEYLTLSFDMPWLPLFNDIKQGIFYAALMVFWLIFAGEHLLNDDGAGGGGEASAPKGIYDYWKKLAVVLFGCICLFIFDVCERGVQLRNPFYSIWVTDLGTQMALAFIIMAGVSAGIFFLFLCFLIYRVFLTIAQKQASLSSMSRVRRLHYQGLIWRFRFLMMATLVTAAMTTIGFILGQVSEGQYKWDEDISLEYTSGFMTGVYGMWNIYIMGLLFLYAPSHKTWHNTSESSHTLNSATLAEGSLASTGEEIEFSVTGASLSEPSEMSSLTDFIRHQATD